MRRGPAAAGTGTCSRSNEAQPAASAKKTSPWNTGRQKNRHLSTGRNILLLPRLQLPWVIFDTAVENRLEDAVCTIILELQAQAAKGARCESKREEREKGREGEREEGRKGDGHPTPWVVTSQILRVEDFEGHGAVTGEWSRQKQHGIAPMEAQAPTGVVSSCVR